MGIHVMGLSQTWVKTGERVTGFTKAVWNWFHNRPWLMCFDEVPA